MTDPLPDLPPFVFAILFEGAPITCRPDFEGCREYLADVMFDHAELYQVWALDSAGEASADRTAAFVEDWATCFDVMAFAKGTTVAIETTTQQIKTMLRKAGAVAFATLEENDSAAIAFRLYDLNIRMTIPMPDRWLRQFTHTADRGIERSDAAAEKLWEQGCKERWRALHLCVKAKLEAIDAGVETFEDAFLAHVQMASGETVGEHLKNQLPAIVAGRAPLQITGPRS